jgi:hypothetical protein
MLENLRTAQQLFQQERDNLRARLSSANRENRELLRERLQTNRDKWLDEASRLQGDIRDRISELKLQLAAHSTLVEDAKERVRDHRGK